MAKLALAFITVKWGSDDARFKGRSQIFRDGRRRDWLVVAGMALFDGFDFNFNTLNHFTFSFGAVKRAAAGLVVGR